MPQRHLRQWVWGNRVRHVPGRLVLPCNHCNSCVGHGTPGHLSARHPRLLALLCVGGAAGATVTGFACRTGTGILSFVDHGCSVPVSYCPLGSSSPLPVLLGSYGLMNSLGLYINAAVCEPGR
jgi:hypothetical protein